MSRYRGLGWTVTLWLAVWPPASGRAEDAGGRSDTSIDSSRLEADHPGRRAKKKKHKRTKHQKHTRVHTDGFRVSAQVRTAVGAMLGKGVRKDQAALAQLSGELTPRFAASDLELALPLHVDHSQTVGADLSESHAGAALQARYRIAPALRIEVIGGIAVLDRPNWPDLYQPTATSYESTDRYGYWERRLGAGVTLHPDRRHWIRGDYDYRLRAYASEPTFDAIRRPNHLTPFDHDQHSAEFGYRFVGRGFRLGARADGFIKNYFFAFARDGRTGFTHAGPGGAPANPLESLRGLRPIAEFELLALRAQLRLEFRYAHEFQQDLHQGYYDYTGPNPRVGIRYQTQGPVELRAGVELWWRTYGAESYQPGIGHPALDSGDRRFDHRLRTSIGARWMLLKQIALILDADHTLRSTNFPDYEPGVFPASQRYAVDWDYSNVRVVAGIEARHD